MAGEDPGNELKGNKKTIQSKAGKFGKRGRKCEKARICTKNFLQILKGMYARSPPDGDIRTCSCYYLYLTLLIRSFAPNSVCVETKLFRGSVIH